MPSARQDPHVAEWIVRQLYHYVYHDYLLNDLAKPVDYASLPASRKVVGVQWEVMSGKVITAIKGIEALADLVYFDASFTNHSDAMWYFCSHCHEGWLNCTEVKHHLGAE